MTGFKSKKAAALDEEGMYLVHHTKGRVFDKLGNKVNDDDTQDHGDALTIAYQNGYYAGKKAAQRPWVSLTDDQIKEIVGPWGDTPIKGYTRKLIDQIDAKLRENNNG